MERKTSQSEVQFGSLVDLSPEELEKAYAATWKMSTPRPRSDTSIASLRTAIEDLLKKISEQNRLLEDRLEELDKRLRTLEGESKHVGKYVLLEGGQSEVELKALETTEALAQPRTIDSSKIQPATARPKVRPTTYDGSSSWEDYAAQFQLVAEINNWDYVTKASYLAISLSGPALSVLGDLSYDQRRDFKDITSALATRFGTEHRTEMFRAQIKTRKRQRNESLPELAQALRRMARQVYPEAPADLRETLACDYFVDSLGDADTRWKVKQSRPRILNEAVDIAVELEAFQLAEQQRNYPARMTYATGNVGSMHNPADVSPDVSFKREVEGLKEIVRRLARERRLQRPQRRFTDGCWTCGRTDHIKRNCPSVKDQERQQPQPQDQWQAQAANSKVTSTFAGYGQVLDDRDLGVVHNWLREAKQKPEWESLSAENKCVKTYWAQWNRLALIDGVLFRRWESDDEKQVTWQLVVPKAMRNDVVTKLHGTKTSGHLGVNKTTTRVKERFYWPNCARDVKDWCKKCELCTSRVGPRPAPQAPMKTLNAVGLHNPQRKKGRSPKLHRPWEGPFVVTD
ncbi:hypothetical protein QZH41_008917 [Actinostola sp. cb2023]|nr:hypothetical protein QZH41_008917 [Actinostola sp. cb2023]